MSVPEEKNKTDILNEFCSEPVKCLEGCGS